jgi:hypothetical protein
LIKSAGGDRNLKPVIILGAVVVLGGALVAWRWMASGPEPLDPAVAQRDREMQAAIEREGLNQPLAAEEEEFPEDQGPPTRAPRQGSEPDGG